MAKTKTSGKISRSVKPTEEPIREEEGEIFHLITLIPNLLIAMKNQNLVSPIVSLHPINALRIYSAIHTDAPEPGPSGTRHDDSPIVASLNTAASGTPMIVDSVNGVPSTPSGDMSEGLKAYLMTIVCQSDPTKCR